jgi:cytochrome b involved in lipid metabolism
MKIEIPFYKGNILISRRYQLHPASAPTRYLRHQGCTQPRNKIKKREIENKDPVTVMKRENVTLKRASEHIWILINDVLQHVDTYQ